MNRISIQWIQSIKASFYLRKVAMEGVQSLVAKDIRKSFSQGGKEVEVLRGISQEFKQGASYGIVGVSGSGKSTFMHIIGGLDTPTYGSVSLFGKPLYGNSSNRSMLNKYMGFVF
ncbi:ATP-binding cassette domain-containing protein, partial [Candidatus Dependentiae bacterium]|nr:ATP-binding cassette domain-containing protein [Candidatus Dependentiae bacterium]